MPRVSIHVCTLLPEHLVLSQGLAGAVRLWVDVLDPLQSFMPGYELDNPCQLVVSSNQA